MKTYNVRIPVYDTIEIVVNADNKEDAEEKAIQKAIDEQPKVYWEIDSDAGVEVREV